MKNINKSNKNININSNRAKNRKAAIHFTLYILKVDIMVSLNKQQEGQS